MKKKFALSLVALASTALLAACGEVKSGASNTTGNPIDEKVVKIGFNSKRLEQQLLTVHLNKRVLNLQLMKSTQQVVSMENRSKQQTKIINLKLLKLLQFQQTLLLNLKQQQSQDLQLQVYTAAAVANATQAGVPLISPSATQDGLTKGQDFLFIGTFPRQFPRKNHLKLPFQTN